MFHKVQTLLSTASCLENSSIRTTMRATKCNNLPQVWLLLTTLICILLGFLVGSSIRRLHEVKVPCKYHIYNLFRSSNNILDLIFKFLVCSSKIDLFILLLKVPIQDQVKGSTQETYLK